MAEPIGCRPPRPRGHHRLLRLGHVLTRDGRRSDGRRTGREGKGDRMETLIRIGHSPDADDAFMFYALTHGKVAVPGVRIEHVLEDIESLNRRAATGELEVTAVSCATYPAIAVRYRIMDPGASMGKGYGPIVVARRSYTERTLRRKVIAIPGYG